MKFKVKVLFTREKLNLLHREFIEEKESGFVFQVTNNEKWTKYLLLIRRSMRLNFTTNEKTSNS